MNLQESIAAFRADRAKLESLGVSWHPGVAPIGYLPDEFKSDFHLLERAMAMDAQFSLSTDPNSGVPSMLTTLIDPAVYEILFAPTMAAEIFGEVRKGTWLDETAMFPVVEHTGEVSTYGDFNNNANSRANMNWPQRQAYLYQTIKEYGERELERYGLGRINYVSELDKSAANSLNRFANLCYFFGVALLQNYGLLNDPNLSAAITPSTKAESGYGTKWILNGIPCAANEIYADIEALYYTLVNQTGGIVAQDSKMTLAMANTSGVALTATNTFNVNVSDLLKKNFTNMRIKVATQYQQISSTNPYGIAAGNFVQLIADEAEGQDTGYCAYNEKMRAHPIIRELSAFKQKVTSGVWGSVIRMPFMIASMVGV